MVSTTASQLHEDLGAIGADATSHFAPQASSPSSLNNSRSENLGLAGKAAEADDDLEEDEELDEDDDEDDDLEEEEEEDDDEEEDELEDEDDEDDEDLDEEDGDDDEEDEEDADEDDDTSLDEEDTASVKSRLGEAVKSARKV